MPDESKERGIPWWRSPGALILWALVGAAIILLLQQIGR